MKIKEKDILTTPDLYVVITEGVIQSGDRCGSAALGSPHYGPTSFVGAEIGMPKTCTRYLREVTKLGETYNKAKHGPLVILTFARREEIVEVETAKKPKEGLGGLLLVAAVAAVSALVKKGKQKR